MMCELKFSNFLKQYNLEIIILINQYLTLCEKRFEMFGLFFIYTALIKKIKMADF